MSTNIKLFDLLNNYMIYSRNVFMEKKMRKVRTRIAPSPTGDPHVGTAYIALFNYCFAEQHKGEFILRIEDTDQVRSTKESETKIFEALKWVGLNWKEGPDIGGPHAPYRQSERKDIYKQYAQQLIDSGHAFYCFATAEELDDMRSQQAKNGETERYDGRGLHLSPETIKKNLADGLPYVVRMKVPTDGSCIFNDMLRGEVSIPWKQIDMQVLLKADGLPTYFLANVVDDHLMEISHVIRGEEWLASTPKIELLYEYFGWKKPVYCHMPLLRNIDKSKLSKRKNPTSIMFYRDKGFTPEALLNYLGRMGWSMPDEREKFSLLEMINDFDITRVSIGGPVFDVNKLSWLNGVWLREMTPYDFEKRYKEWTLINNKLVKLLPMAQSRVENFGQVNKLIGFMYDSDLNYDKSIFEHKKLTDGEVKKALQIMLWDLESLKKWNEDEILETLKKSASKLNLKLKDVMPLVFATVTGSLSSISVIDAMALLGPDMTRYRFRKVIDILGGFEELELNALIENYN